MWPWTRRDITPVGVEIDGSAIRLAQVEFRSGHPPAVTLLSRSLAAITKPTDLDARTLAGIGLLRGMLSEGGFVGRQVVTRLPDHLVHLRTLRLASGRSIGVDATVRLESRSLFPVPEHLQLSYIEAGQTRYGPESRDDVIVAASRRSEVERLLAEFDRAGLDVTGLDLGPCAAYRACRWSAEDEREIHAVLEIGRQAAHVVIGKGRQIRFLKRIPLGADHLAEAVSRRLGVPIEDGISFHRRLTDGPDTPDRRTIRGATARACRPLLESLAAEVSGCLRYYGVSFRGRPIERLLVSGRGAADPQLGSVLSAVISAAVRVADPLVGLQPRSPSTCDASEWSAVLGLAIKSAAGTVPSSQADLPPVGAPAMTAAAVRV